MRKYIKSHFSKTSNSSKGEPKPQHASASQTPEHTLAIHTIYSDPNPTLDVIAIHGHTGHHIHSFTHPDTHCLWLKDLLPPIFHSPSSSQSISIRILSLSYTSKDEDILGAKGIASFFLTELVGMSVGGEGRGILWAAHSFGGPLLKGMLRFDDEEGEKLGDGTRGCLMFGVARGGGVWDSFSGGGSEEGMSDEMKRLRDEVLWLKESSEKFESESRERGWEVTYVLECSGDVVGTGEGRDVWEEGVRVVRSSKTHGKMVKFEGEEDRDWLAVKRVMNDMLPRLTTQTLRETS
ncbi:hypothetical protein B0J14DRAFT_565592 [Halenospora varia]|nr:hypothetical protein B0J14DRAFT_565592 [Halenospora varia]